MKVSLNPLPHNNDDFYAPGEKTLLKTLRVKEKMLVTSIFSFSHNVFYPSQNKFQFSVTCILSSSTAFNLDQSEMLFGKELILGLNGKGLVKFLYISPPFRVHFQKLLKHYQTFTLFRLAIRLPAFFSRNILENAFSVGTQCNILS